MQTADVSPASTPVASRLSRHTALLLFSNVGGAAFAFLFTVIIARGMGDAALGSYAVVMAWVAPLTMLVEFGLSTLVTREVAQHPEQMAAYTRSMLVLRIVLGGLAFAVLMLGAPLLSARPEIQTGLRISAPLLIITPLYTTFTALFKARGQMWPVPLLNLGMLAAQAGWTAAIMGPQTSVEDLFAINLWTSVGQLGAAWLVYQARFSPGSLAPVALPPLSTLLRRAWPFALAAVFATAQTRLSVILLEHFFTAADAGYFSAASRITEALRLLPNALFGALFPTLAVLALYPTLLQKTFKRIFAGLALFSMLVGLFCTFAAPVLIPLVYGPEFSPAVPVLSLLSWALGVSLLRGARTLYLYALGQEHRVNLLNGISLIIHLVIGLLVSTWGANGAALALFIGEAIALLLLFLPHK